MKNSFGNSIVITLFGESHGDYIGAVLDGLAPGIKINHEYISAKLALRRPAGKISTSRVEADEYRIVSGEFNGYTTGTPLCILIPNTNKKSSDYGEALDLPRPGHADFTARMKYHGFEDHRGGGHFSGRLTAAIVAAGALLGSALENKGIKIGSHITELHGAFDRPFEDYESDIDSVNKKPFPTEFRIPKGRTFLFPFLIPFFTEQKQDEQIGNRRLQHSDQGRKPGMRL